MHDKALLDTAINWRVRLASAQATDRDWSEFTSWLEADPANGNAYDRVALAEMDYEEVLSIAPKLDVPPAGNDNEVQPWYRRRSFLAVAASAAFALVATPLIFPNRDLTPYETKAGQTREIALGDGSKIELNGASRIAVDLKSNRYARLDSGEATFTIKHDAANPFTLDVDKHQLVDVGTEFNVRQDVDSLEIAVGDGAVQYNPDSDRLLISAGNQLSIGVADARPVVRSTDPASVGGWRKGRLAYRGETFKRIAVDLSRRFGEQGVVSDSIQSRRFSGLIQVSEDEEASMQQVSLVLGVKVRHNRSGWVLTE